MGAWVGWAVGAWVFLFFLFFLFFLYLFWLSCVVELSGCAEQGGELEYAL